MALTNLFKTFNENLLVPQQPNQYKPSSKYRNKKLHRRLDLLNHEDIIKKVWKIQVLKSLLVLILFRLDTFLFVTLEKNIYFFISSVLKNQIFQMNY